LWAIGPIASLLLIFACSGGRHIPSVSMVAKGDLRVAGPAGGSSGAGLSSDLDHSPAREIAHHAREPPAITCNGSRELCDRPFDQVTFAATHNAHAIARSWRVAAGLLSSLAPGGDNQERTLHEQLEDGVRGMMIDLGRAKNGRIDMCHGGCGLLDYGTFASGLETIRSFLDEHPTETVTMMLELTDGVTSADASRALREEGLASYAFVKRASDPWPVLRDLGKRMILFSQDGAADLVMAYWDHAFENPYHYEGLAEFERDDACSVDRGNGHGLFVFNHFLTPKVALPAGWGFIANGASVGEHVERCIRAAGRAPNFVTVDWYDEGTYGGGTLFTLVRGLNERRFAPRLAELHADRGTSRGR
jgi:hypothetical protein